MSSLKTNKKISKVAGFTLIEMMVVVVIIAVLSMVVSASYSKARMKSRDSRRMSDLESIASALGLFNDEHGHMPNTGDDSSLVTQAGTQCSHYLAAFSSNAGGEWYSLGAILAPYINPFPRSPYTKSLDTYYLYGYRYCNQTQFHGTSDVSWKKRFHLAAGLETLPGNPAKMYQTGEDVCGTGQGCAMEYPNMYGNIYVLKN